MAGPAGGAVGWSDESGPGSHGSDTLAAALHVLVPGAACVAAGMHLARLVRLRPEPAEALFWRWGTARSLLRRYDVVFCLLALLSQYLLYSRGTMIMAHFPVPRHEPWWRQVHHLTAFSRIFPEVLATLAVAQLCAITFWPEPYSRWRNAWMVVGRTVRFGAILSIVTYQQHPGIVFNMKRDMEMMTEGGLRGVLAMLRMMIVNSGAMHMGLHACMNLAPLRLALVFQTLLTIMMAWLYAPFIATLMRSTALARAAGLLCDGLSLGLAMVLDVVVPPEKFCSEDGHRALLTTTIFVVGFVGPMSITAMLELLLKNLFVAHVAAVGPAAAGWPALLPPPAQEQGAEGPAAGDGQGGAAAAGDGGNGQEGPGAGGGGGAVVAVAAAQGPDAPAVRVQLAIGPEAPSLLGDVGSVVVVVSCLICLVSLAVMLVPATLLR